MGLRIPAVPQELFDTTRVSPTDLQKLRDRLQTFARSFAPFFYRKQQGARGKIPSPEGEMLSRGHTCARRGPPEIVEMISPRPGEPEGDDPPDQ